MNLIKKALSLVFIIAGISIVSFSLGADLLGLGGQPGIGFRQILLATFGLVVLIAGIFLATPSGYRVLTHSISTINNRIPVFSNFREHPFTIVIIAFWFGLFTGLVEGLLLRLLQTINFLKGSFIYLGSSIEIVWISAICDVILFGIIGLILVIVSRFFPKLPVRMFSVFLFGFLLFFDWLLIFLHDRIYLAAIIILTSSLSIELFHQYRKHEEWYLSFWRWTLPKIAVFVLLVFISIQGINWLKEQIEISRLPAANPGSPNILVIVVDTLRADHLATYGYSRYTSPNIDHIAQDGVVFENAISSSSWTIPAHISFLSGRYLFELKNSNMDFPTIGDWMQALGYRTGAFSGNYWNFSRSTGFGHEFIHFDDYYRTLGDFLTGTLYGRFIEYDVLHNIFGLKYKIGRKSASDLNQSFLNWIDGYTEMPFFAFINYYDVHDPYIPPQPYRSKFSQVKDPGGLINTDWDINHIYLPLTPEQLQGEVDAYDGAIAYVDGQIGDLIDELQKRDFAKNTIIVITSDHGEMFGEHGLFNHFNSLYRELIHVPLIIWWPGHIPAGKNVSQPVSITALPATLLDLLGANESRQLSSPSLTQLWNKSDIDTNWPSPISEVDQLFWAPPEDPTAHGAMMSMVGPEWHFITHQKFGEELYDWVVDTKEMNNLVKDQDVQAIIAQYRKLIQLQELRGGE